MIKNSVLSDQGVLEISKKLDEQDDIKTMHRLMGFDDDNNSLLENALQEGFDISVKDDMGWTPLHYGCY